MNNEVFQEYLRQLVKEALNYGEGTVTGAASYLSGKKKPFFITRHLAEKRLALERAQKIFGNNRDRPLWFVLKCMGLTLEDIE
jgi:hypothetical protein